MIRNVARAAITNRESRCSIVKDYVVRGPPGVVVPGDRGIGRNRQRNRLGRRVCGQEGRGTHTKRAGWTCGRRRRRGWRRGWRTHRAVTSATARHQADRQNQNTKQTMNPSHSPSKLERLNAPRRPRSADAAIVVYNGPVYGERKAARGKGMSDVGGHHPTQGERSARTRASPSRCTTASPSRRRPRQRYNRVAVKTAYVSGCRDCSRSPGRTRRSFLRP